MSASAPVDSLKPKDLQNERLRAEIWQIEQRLKTWFINRRVSMERNISLRKVFWRYNMVGLSMNGSTPEPGRSMWEDIVTGKPDVEDSLSMDGREMKADMYMKLFKEATDIEHVCRIPGVSYLRCIQENYKVPHPVRNGLCGSQFTSFDVCRKGIILQQETSVKNSLLRQHREDMESQELFNLRLRLLDSLKGETVSPTFS